MSSQLHRFSIKRYCHRATQKKENEIAKPGNARKIHHTCGFYDTCVGVDIFHQSNFSPFSLYLFNNRIIRPQTSTTCWVSSEG